MPEDYYEGSPQEEASETPAEESAERKDDSSEKETFLVPKSALMGKDPQPGEECKFRAVHSYEDEIEFEYVKHDEKSKSSMGAADEQMDQMASQNMEAEEA